MQSAPGAPAASEKKAFFGGVSQVQKRKLSSLGARAGTGFRTSHRRARPEALAFSHGLELGRSRGLGL